MNTTSPSIPVDASHFPDERFRTWIKTHISGADSGVLTFSELASVHTISLINQNIFDLSGIEYFVNLSYLTSTGNPLRTLKQLPDSITNLGISSSSLVSLPKLPSELVILNVPNNQLAALPQLPNKLEHLFCNNNALTALPALPLSLKEISFDQNQIAQFPTIPDNILSITAAHNLLTVLPALPESLTILVVAGNQLTTLHNSLPENLGTLSCAYNNLVQLPNLPPGLTVLFTNDNQIGEMPPLPAALEQLNCSRNQLTALDLSNCTALTQFYGIEQNPYLTLTGNSETGYATKIALNNPYFTQVALRYEQGELTSTDNRIDQTDFAVNTGLIKYPLSGTMHFSYVEGTPPSGTGIPINETTFPDNAFRNWILVHVPQASDYYLTPQEIAQITSLDPVNTGIKSLKGIEYFTSLQSLRCASNYLSSLPSLPRSLKLLDCSNNNFDTLVKPREQLPPTLEVLSCPGNRLTTLPFLPMTLTHLDCSHNYLISADLTPLYSLESFKGDNQIAQLTLAQSNGPLYTLQIPLDSPTFSESPVISYASGVLSSSDATIRFTEFTTETNLPGKELAGILGLQYESLAPPSSKP